MNDTVNLMRSRKLARAAILLAATAVIQISGRYLAGFLGPLNIFIIGTFVNACLFIALDYAGFWGATAIALIAPFTALLTGAPIPIPFIPFIGVGNFLLILFFSILKKSVVGIFVGALVKFSFLFGSVLFFLKLMDLSEKVAAGLFFTFSWPQIITALLGGGVYLAAKRVLKVDANLV